MSTVFIAGSIKIKKLDPSFSDRIYRVVSEGHQVIVGDASGADTSIQKELLEQQAPDVTVYCSGTKPRNNIGKWNIKTISSLAPEGTREFFTAKDQQMAKDADFGLMLWDSASTGTLSNVLELLKQEKKSVVFINKSKHFITVRTVGDLHELVSAMSEGAKAQAERKIGLRNKIFQASSYQTSLSI